MGKERVIDYLRDTAPNILKAEFKAERDKIMSLQFTLEDFRNHVIGIHPEYNCPEGTLKIRNTWYIANGDVLLTRLMKEFANQIGDGHGVH